ncbi:Ger(x)C family spore germination protein [Halalkalibacter oceani]|uniref:Ger(x)C family spore germination protein n=1 Tax=Halalkalibacter oceani TaxID=1653776 RepID=UPI003398291C
MKRYLPLVSLWLLLFLTGCYDLTELEQKAYVVAIGIDRTDEQGMYEVSFQMANPEVGTTTQAAATDEQPKETVTLVAPDFISAQNTANSFVTRELTFDHTKVLIISEELARSGELLNIIQSANQESQLRRGVQMIVSKEKASEFLTNTAPPMETRPHKYYQFMLERGQETGLIPDADIHRFFQITEGDADLFLAIYATSMITDKGANGSEDEYVAGEVPQVNRQETQFIGSAVFKEGTMIDRLDGEETRLTLIMDNTLNMEDVLTTYPDPMDDHYRITTKYIQKDKTSVKINYVQDGQAKIDIYIPFHLEVLAVPSLIDYSNNKENLQLLRTSLETYITDVAEKLIKKTQEEYKSEPFYWSLYVRHHFKTISEYEAADWHNQIYPNADITITFDLKNIRFGKLIKSADLDEVRD